MRAKASTSTQKALSTRSRSVLDEPKLTQRERAFVAEYLKDRNGTQAAIRAGYSKASAGTIASGLLKKLHVRAELDRVNDELMAEAKRIAGLTLERLTLEVARGAFFDARRLSHDDGTPKALHELDDDTASAIAGIELEEVFEGRGEDRRHVGRIHKFKLVDRKAFVDMGLRVIGGYKEDNKQQNSGEALADMLKDMKRSALPVVARVDDDEVL
jgi:phage terminase small subunit